MKKEKRRTLVWLLFISSFIMMLVVSYRVNRFISFTTHTIEDNIERRLITTSQKLANFVSAEELDNYRTVSDMELPAYKELRERLLEFSRETDVVYAYYMRRYGDSLQYIVDNDFNDSTRVGLDTDPYHISVEPKVNDVFEGRSVATGMGNYIDGWDGLISAYSPVFDTNGVVTALAAVDINDKDIILASRMLPILTVVQIIAIVAIFISGLVGFVSFRRQVKIAREANEKLRSLATTDELTKLDNRRAFMENLNVVWKQNSRLRLPLTVFMIDVDYFKRYNDSMGHLSGDKALIAIAEHMKKQLKRETDFIARFGGEEFISLIPFLDEDKALPFAEKLVRSVESMNILHPDSDVSKYVTVSVGLSTVIPGEGISQTEFLEQADKALYKAKQSGRNRAVQ